MMTEPQFGPVIPLLSEFLKNNNYSKAFVLTDENTSQYCLPVLRNGIKLSLEEISIPSGESNKTLQTCEAIWIALTEAGADRKAVLINLGGGVIGDMGGFCASTYKRGISFINIPTTLLSQVDASVGGKLGIDFHSLKNHIGIFQEPNAVFVDDQFLTTLPARQVKSGFAEIIKHCLIGNTTMWNHLLQTPYDQLKWDKIVPESVKVKTNIVSNDFRESGERKLLNFGHTIGHAVEALFLENGKDLLHGEAVAAGMIMESYISAKAGNLSPNEFTEIVQFIDSNYSRLSLGWINFDDVMTRIMQDKKNSGNTINMVALENIGKGKWDVPVYEADIKAAWKNYTSA